MGYHKEVWLKVRWKDNRRFTLSAYRFLAFTVASIQILLAPTTHQFSIPPLYLVIGVGIYTLFKALHPLRWYQDSVTSYSLFGSDIAICIFLVTFTGGIYSPFLLYTLAPVLTSALLLDGRVTFGIAGFSVIYVIVSHVVNPFFATQLYLAELSYLLIYIVAVCLTAILPYMINLNLRQHFQSQDILGERQRLSREIHDGAAQTISALYWQAQLIHRRLVEMGIDSSDSKELCRLTQKAQNDIRESLELLRTYISNGSFLPCLKDNLIHLKQNSNINFKLDIETEEFQLETPVEIELLRICQEALTNIRTHSGARNISGNIRPMNGRILVTIADDGCGFNILDFYHDGREAKGHGLAVMRERAESVGGCFRVLSIPGKGTEIQVEVPAKSKQRRFLWLKR
jgi:signal transduction histidine kinase